MDTPQAVPTKPRPSFQAAAKEALWQLHKAQRRALETARVACENILQRRVPLQELAILDNFFPHFLSAFRVAEFNAYLARFPSARVHSSTSGFHLIKESRSFREVRDVYEARYPEYRGRAVKFHARRELRARVAYTLFLNNAKRFLDVIEAQRLPFAFTLYPGGGFRIDQPECDSSLRRVLGSPCFRKVITTQRVTDDYLRSKAFCPPECIEFVYGGVVPSDQLTRAPIAKRRYLREKDTFDVCFVANKYSPSGADKGFDLFMHAARHVRGTLPHARFHVVGSFAAEDGAQHDPHHQVQFYGIQPTDFFPEFYAGMDVILSANAPFVVDAGAFDGFPTGACMEAGLCGVALFCADDLKLNVAFCDGRELVIIPREVDRVCGLLVHHATHYDDLCRLAERGQDALRRVFHLDTQMAPRFRVIEQCAATA
jgi:glycosyltransferase involved in cell wall biosynthesis